MLKEFKDENGYALDRPNFLFIIVFKKIHMFQIMAMCKKHDIFFAIIEDNSGCGYFMTT